MAEQVGHLASPQIHSHTTCQGWEFPLPHSLPQTYLPGLFCRWLLHLLQVEEQGVGCHSVCLTLMICPGQNCYFPGWRLENSTIYRYPTTSPIPHPQPYTGSFPHTYLGKLCPIYACCSRWWVECCHCHALGVNTQCVGDTNLPTLPMGGRKEAQ